MANVLRQRHRGDSPLASVRDEVVPPKISRYKFLQKCFLVLGTVALLFLLLFVTFSRLDLFVLDDESLDIDLYAPDIRHLFQKYDRNYDNYLSLDEFEPIAAQLANSRAPTDCVQPILSTDQLVTIDAFFEPFDVNTMTKNFRYTYASNLDELQFLKMWKQPHISHANFAARHFQSFIPQQIVIGKPYWIVKGTQQEEHTEHLSSNRYHPPNVNNEHLILHRLLSMFHQRPFLLSRFPPQGTLAVVRARHGPFLDIYFRMHAEFQLNTPPYHPFWYTPAQFQGRLIIREDASELIYFRMRVPSEKKLNIDMEWLSSGGHPSANMEVDIGHMPRMELLSVAPSVDMNQTGITADQFVSTMNETLYESLLNSFDWRNDNYLSERDTFDLLERTFYPFKEIPYYDYREAFHKAEQANKLVHSIILWGALDDQSC